MTNDGAAEQIDAGREGRMDTWPRTGAPPGTAITHTHTQNVSHYAVREKA